MTITKCCIFTSCLVLLASVDRACAEEDDRPNIVLIVADDVGFSDIGAFGSEIATPNLDALAHEGLQLTAFHAAPTCGPSRTMLLTGVDHHLAGAGTNAAGLMRLPQLRGRPGYEGYLNDSVVSFVTLLRDAGYHTYMTGKWDPGDRPGQLPIDHGFEESFVLASGGASHFADAVKPSSMGPDIAYYDGERRVDALPEDFYSSDFYTDRMIEYIDGNDNDAPYMALLSYTAGHWPLQVPDEWLDRYAGAYDEGWHAVREARFNRLKDSGVVPANAKLPPRNRAVDDWERLRPFRREVELKRMQIFAAMIENMDFHIGRLLEAIRDDGSRRDTVIVFLSDNGSEGNSIDRLPGNDYWIPSVFDNRLENLGRRGSFVWLGVGWAHVGAAPFRLYKSYTTAGALRTPAIIYSTRERFGRGKKHAVVTVRDIAPTLLELAEVEQPGDTYAGKTVHAISGRSAVDYLRGDTDTVHGDAPLGWEAYGSRALLKGDWKAVRTYPPEGSGQWQLFDLASDPTEINDVAAEFPEVIEELADDWETYARENGVVVFDKDMGYGRYFDAALP